VYVIILEIYSMRLKPSGKQSGRPTYRIIEGRSEHLRGRMLKLSLSGSDSDWLLY